MATQSTLSVSYKLSPPEGTIAPPSLAQNATYSFTVEADKSANIREYYGALQKSIVASKGKLGEELTAWRDAVGNAETGKENAAKATQSEDEEEEEEDQTCSL